MLLVFLSWCLLGASAFLWGYAGLRLCERLTEGSRRKGTKAPFGGVSQSLDLTIMTGLCMLTVYAQAFSLFYKVSALAFWLQLLVSLLLVLCLRRELTEKLRQGLWLLKKRPVLTGLGLAALCFLGLVLLVWSSERVSHYDTYLYHAQSIRWIEEYGVVPGLGNLHNRLAYNSSLFSLQALFSLSFLAGQSLHSVNGFVALLLISYALFSMKAFRKHRLFASDFLRLTIFFLYTNSYSYVQISSPGSDFLALGLVCYILIKWVSCLEDGEEGLETYCCLSLLGVFAVTVKLSGAMIVLLAALPAVRLVKERRWREIVVYVSAGVLILLPFLARNVMISGYLLYPYETLDLFAVEWKMPAFALEFDRTEIKVWGWGLKDVTMFDTPFREWFPLWFSGLDSSMRFLFAANFAGMAGSLVFGLAEGIKKRKGDFLWISLVMLSNVLLWFLGAPSPRYGGIYLALLPLLAAGTAAGKLCKGQREVSALLARTAPAIMAVFAVCSLFPMVKGAFAASWNVKRCADYDFLPCTEYILEGQTIYVPEQGDQAGYHAFPSTPYAGRLDKIELRGETFKEGFRMKEEYRDKCVSPYGEVYEENWFEEKG